MKTLVSLLTLLLFTAKPLFAAEATTINAADLAKQQKKQNEMAAERQAALRRYNLAVATKMEVIGKVTQVTQEGLLVTAEAQKPVQIGTRRFGYSSVNLFKPPTEVGCPLFVGRCLIMDAKTAGWIDDQRIRATVYANGTYTYESVGGVSRTIAKFALNPANVTTPASPAQFEALKATYEFNATAEEQAARFQARLNSR